MELDNLLLILSQVGVFIYAAFSIIGTFHQLEDHLLAFLASLATLIQTTIQTVFILDASSRWDFRWYLYANELISIKCWMGPLIMPICESFLGTHILQSKFVISLVERSLHFYLFATLQCGLSILLKQIVPILIQFK